IIGHGDRSTISGDHEYLGPLDPVERTAVMSQALAMLAPTTYLEPFGAAPVEAQFCGVPLITTDARGVPRNRCGRGGGRSLPDLGEFVDACEHVGDLSRSAIRRRAVSLYSMHVLQDRYQHYFERLATLWADGWHTKRRRLVTV